MRLFSVFFKAGSVNAGSGENNRKNQIEKRFKGILSAQNQYFDQKIRQIENGNRDNENDQVVDELLVHDKISCCLLLYAIYRKTVNKPAGDAPLEDL